ncbi:hypothetical protein OQA88_1129 [Cercophora sp. LCS_1]
MDAKSTISANGSRDEFNLTSAQREAQGLPVLEWSDSAESSNDFRSDFFTRPTLPMLEAIIRTTLGDGEMEEDKTTTSFQEYVADLLGVEAALLVISGTMGNQVSLRTALRSPPHSILADYRGHVVTLEGGGSASACGALIKMVVPANGHHLTLEDVKKHSVLTESMYDCPTRVICLENTLWGTIIPLADIRAISQWARAQTPPIHMHLDGARLWEAAAAGACAFREIGECFDSIQLCFTKGLGAPIGSVIAGSAEFIKRAKWARKLFGGSTRTSGVIAAPARVAIDDVFLGGKLQAAHKKARVASSLWEELGGKLSGPTETNMMWFDLEGSGLTDDDFYPVAKEFNIKVGAPIFGRLVFHYQITDAALGRLCDFFRAVLGRRKLPKGALANGTA